MWLLFQTGYLDFESLLVVGECIYEIVFDQLECFREEFFLYKCSLLNYLTLRLQESLRCGVEFNTTLY